MTQPRESRQASPAVASVSNVATTAGINANDPHEFPSDYTPRYGRIPVMQLQPQLDDNRFPSRASVGEVVPFQAVAYREGHDLIGTEIVLTSPEGVTERIRMRPGRPGLDEWVASAQVTTVGT
jgi:starch synthase (maltosyl-transferring)